jgi:hypothetical protein
MSSEVIPDSDGKDGAGFAWIALRVCVVLVIYVLSSGPAMWLHSKTTNHGLQSALRAAYAPVVFLVNKTPLKGVGARWVHEWVDVPESRAWLPPSP